jgi:hypothetical protein
MFSDWSVQFSEILGSMIQKANKPLKTSYNVYALRIFCFIGTGAPSLFRILGFVIKDFLHKFLKNTLLLFNNFIDSLLKPKLYCIIEFHVNV